MSRSGARLFSAGDGPAEFPLPEADSSGGDMSRRSGIPISDSDRHRLDSSPREIPSFFFPL